MLKNHMRRCFAIILLSAAIVASAPDARAGEHEVKKAAAIDTPDAVKHGELVFHGNYCGVGNRAGADPIDALDVSCMHHDACTLTGKVQSCACNAKLAEEAGAVALDPKQTAELKSLATITATVATAGMVLCVPAPLTAERAESKVAAPSRPAETAPVAADTLVPKPLAPPLELVRPAATVRTAP
jgi:hypothetical protein